MALINVKKADGQVEAFSEKKLRKSLKSAGAKPASIEAVVTEIDRSFKGRTASTSQIYKKAFFALRKVEIPATAARYSLKRAVLDLGPSGFPFEYFLTEIFKTKGYKTETGTILTGGCGTHEVDVVAINDKEVIAVEAKFHNKLGFKTDMKVLLYVAARFEDLKKNNFDHIQKPGMTGKGMIITNTDFTLNAISYAECSGVEAVSWAYPRKGNLHDMIEEAGLHPLTCLTTISDAHKKALLERGTVLCKMIQNDSEQLSKIGISKSRIPLVLEEAALVCRPERFK
jgi:hypothetical protein